MNQTAMALVLRELQPSWGDRLRDHTTEGEVSALGKHSSIRMCHTEPGGTRKAFRHMGSLSWTLQDEQEFDGPHVQRHRGLVSVSSGGTERRPLWPRKQGGEQRGTKQTRW